METQNKFSSKKRAKSFVYAFNGIKILFTTQHNVWIHTVIAIMVITAGFLLKMNTTEWCFIIFAIGIVFMAEIINTAIEYFVDLVSPEHNEKAGKVKDLAAGGALIAAITSASIGLIVFVPKIYELI